MTLGIQFRGLSGRVYTFYPVDRATTDGILAVPGNYMFAKLLPTGVFAPIYLGQAEDLRARIPSHEVWHRARALGATHILAHQNHGGKNARCAEERDLIEYWRPPLNTQHNTRPKRLG